MKFLNKKILSAYFFSDGANAIHQAMDYKKECLSGKIIHKHPD